MEERQARRERRKSVFKRNNLRNALCVCILLLVLGLGCSLVTVLKPAKAYSESENRMLAQTPALTLDAVKDGSFFSGLESAYADQFVGRDGWIGAKLGFDRFFGAKESSGVYLAADNYLIQIPSDPNDAAVERNLAAISAFAEANPDTAVYMTVVPNAVSVLSDKLPKDAPAPNQTAQLNEIKAALQGVEFLDVTDALLAHKTEEIYYHTDHHWTSLGARYAFEAMAEAMEIEPVQEYKIYTVSGSFEGTLSARSGSHDWKDRVDLYVPQPEADYKVVYADTQKITASIYEKSALEAKDHYTVFFGGNHPRLDITTTVDTERRLLIFKDSYANCFVQFLTPYFSRIILVDPRYYYEDVSILMKQNQITDVLFLYNLDTFLSDNALADVLESGLPQPEEAAPEESGPKTTGGETTAPVTTSP